MPQQQMNPWLALGQINPQGQSPWQGMNLMQPKPQQPSMIPSFSQAQTSQQALAPQGTSMQPSPQKAVYERMAGQVEAMNPPQSMEEQLAEAQMRHLQTQGLSVEALRSRLAEAEGQGLPMDLTGLAALTDTWTGSNFMQSYRPEETSREREALKERLQAAVAQGEQGLGAQEIGFLQDRLGMQRQDRQDKEKMSLEYAKLDAMKDRAGLQLTPAQKAVDTKFAGSYHEDITEGGIAGAQGELLNLKDLERRIAGGEYGEISGPSIGMTPESLRAIFHPKAKDAQDTILKQVQSSLRATLGAQFTEREGQMIFDRTFDPKQPPEVNMRRMRMLVAGLEKAQEAKMRAYQHYEQHGTLANFPGASAFSRNVENDFLRYIKGESAGGAKAAPTDADKKALDWAKSNPDDPRAMQILQMHEVE